jgi:5-methylcytosine-specific restriction endonuclease McrA
MTKRSALTNNGSTSRWRKIRERVLVRDNYTCYYCACEATTVDHIVPRRLGGDDSMDNLVAACKKCNYSKGGRFFESTATPPTPHGLFMPENSHINHFEAS